LHERKGTPKGAWVWLWSRPKSLRSTTPFDPILLVLLQDPISWVMSQDPRLMCPASGSNALG